VPELLFMPQTTMGWPASAGLPVTWSQVVNVQLKIFASVFAGSRAVPPRPWISAARLPNAHTSMPSCAKPQNVSQLSSLEQPFPPVVFGSRDDRAKLIALPVAPS
jgi:hypothetical protein